MPISLSTARAMPAKMTAFESIMAANAQPAADAAPITLSDYLGKIQGYGARQHYRRNEAIFNQNDPAEQVYRIVSGTVRLCRYMPDGRRYIVDFLLPGDLMGFVESPDQPMSAEAVGDVTLVVFPRVCFNRLAKENAGARMQLLCHLSANLLTAQQHLVVLGCQKARERVSSFLLRLADRMDISYDDRLDLVMSRQDIADHLGLTIETVSRAFTGLRGEGLILLPNAHQVILRNRDGLRALASEK